MSTLVERLQIALARKGLSRRRLAEMADVHPNTLNGWFSGATKNPQTHQLHEVAKILDVPYDWLRIGRGPVGFDLLMGIDYGMTAAAPVQRFDDITMIGPEEAPLLGLIAAYTASALAGADPMPPATKIGAAVIEIYNQCKSEGKQPTPEMVASFVRVLLA